MLLNILQGSGQVSLPKNYSAPNSNSAELKKPQCRSLNSMHSANRSGKRPGNTAWEALMARPKGGTHNFY